MTERRLRVGWGAVFSFVLFFFFAFLFFSSQPKVFSLYPGYLRVFFLSRVRQDASVSVDLLPKA